MHKKHPKVSLITLLMLFLLSSALSAQDIDTPGWTKTRDNWGQLLFCQRIYTLPEVKTRLYSFDTEQCDKAKKPVQDLVSGYSTQQQALLKNQAEQHAYRISQNTSEPYHAVGACRDFCKELVEHLEKNDE